MKTQPPVWARVIWPVLAVALTAWAIYFFWRQAQTWDAAGLDVGIYREAARELLDGHDVYLEKFGPVGLPFTYPPFALVIFIPFALLPIGVTIPLMFALSSVALLLIVKWCVEYVRPGLPVNWWAVIALAAGSSTILEPVRTSLGLGQINLLLLLVIMLFDMRQVGRLAGIGAGIASAVKITPAILVVAQAVRGKWRAMWCGVAAFVVCTLVAAVIAPVASKEYFLHLLWDSARPGNLDYLGNQSLRAVWERHFPGQSAVLWVLTGVAALVFGFIAVRRSRADAWVALTAAAVTGLLLSPVSWSHHWVWVLPAAAVGYRCLRTLPYLAAASALLLLPTVLAPLVWTVVQPPWWVQDMYVVVGFIWLIAVAVFGARLVASTSPTTTST